DRWNPPATGRPRLSCAAGAADLVLQRRTARNAEPVRVNTPAATSGATASTPVQARPDRVPAVGSAFRLCQHLTLQLAGLRGVGRLERALDGHGLLRLEGDVLAGAVKINDAPPARGLGEFRVLDLQRHLAGVLELHRDDAVTGQRVDRIGGAALALDDRLRRLGVQAEPLVGHVLHGAFHTVLFRHRHALDPVARVLGVGLRSGSTGEVARQHHCRDGYAGPRQQRRRHPGNDLLLGELHYLLLFSTPPGGGEVHFPKRVAPSSLRALLTCGGTSTYTTTTRPIATVEARRTIRLLTLRSDRAIGDERFGTALATVDSRLLGCAWETGCSPHTRFVLPSRVRPGPRRDAANLPSESRPERGRCGKGRP